MGRMCRYSSVRCYHGGKCSFLDSMGNVCVCPLFRGGNMFTPRKVVSVDGFVFSEHLRGGF